MHSLLNIITISYLYVNILVPKITLFNVPINKILFAIMISLYICHVLINRTIKKEGYYIYALTVFSCMLILANTGLLLMNDFNDIMGFVYSLTVLLAIPVFSLLFENYGIEKYLNHILVAVMILGVYVLALFLFFSQFPTWNPYNIALNEIKVLGTTVLYRENGLQIALVASGWLPIGLVIVLNKLTDNFKIRYVICAMIIIFAIYFGKIAGILISTMFAVAVYYLINLKTNFARLLSTVIIIIITLGSLMFVSKEIIDLKLESMHQKREQSAAAIAIFADNLLLGKGLGYKYQQKEIPSLSGEENVFLETTYPMILSSTGLIGALCYAFIFLYYPMRYVLNRNKNQISNLLLVCYVTVLVEAIGNPFLWGGGLGMLLLCVFIASFHCNSAMNLNIKKLVNATTKEV